MNILTTKKYQILIRETHRNPASTPLLSMYMDEEMWEKAEKLAGTWKEWQLYKEYAYKGVRDRNYKKLIRQPMTNYEKSIELWNKFSGSKTEYKINDI